MTRLTHHALAALIGTALLAGAAQAADSKIEARIERGAAHASTAAQAEAQGKLDAVAKKIDQAAAQAGDAKLSAQLAGELGTTPGALLAERADASWGTLVIAHRLAASAEVPASALLDLHEDGMGWGTIASGLGLSTSQAVRAATTVAVGSAVNAATGASVGAATASVGLGAGLGLSLGR